MNKLNIQIDDDRREFLPGQRIEGNVQWQCQGNLKEAQLRLFWYTQGKGTEDVLLVDEIRFENPAHFNKEHFAFELPVGPYSFSGSLISLIWALELEVGGDCVRTEFTVSPTGKEILLKQA